MTALAPQARLAVSDAAGIALKFWDDDAILYHGASGYTGRVSLVLARGLQLLCERPHSIDEIGRALASTGTEASCDDLRSHLTEGLEQLLHRGIVSRAR